MAAENCDPRNKVHFKIYSEYALKENFYICTNISKHDRFLLYLFFQ